MPSVAAYRPRPIADDTDYLLDDTEDNTSRPVIPVIASAPMASAGMGAARADLEGSLPQNVQASRMGNDVAERQQPFAQAARMAPIQEMERRNSQGLAMEASGMGVDQFRRMGQVVDAQRQMLAAGVNIDQMRGLGIGGGGGALGSVIARQVRPTLGVKQDLLDDTLDDPYKARVAGYRADQDAAAATRAAGGPVVARDSAGRAIGQQEAIVAMNQRHSGDRLRGDQFRRGQAARAKAANALFRIAATDRDPGTRAAAAEQATRMVNEYAGANRPMTGIEGAVGEIGGKREAGLAREATVEAAKAKGEAPLKKVELQNQGRIDVEGEKTKGRTALLERKAALDKEAAGFDRATQVELLDKKLAHDALIEGKKLQFASEDAKEDAKLRLSEIRHRVAATKDMNLRQRRQAAVDSLMARFKEVGYTGDMLAQQMQELFDGDLFNAKAEAANALPAAGAAPAAAAAPTQDDINYLKSHPDMKAKFDAMFGAGAADKYLK